MKPINVILLILCFFFIASAFRGDITSPPKLRNLWYKYGNTVGGDYSYFGYSIVGIGDQNGDSFYDILVGNNNENKAYIFFGGVILDTIPDLIFREDAAFGIRVANLGDLNGDNKIDFAITSGKYIYVYYGGTLDTTPTLRFTRNYGRVASAGDVNGDGYSDMLVSELNWNDLQGKVDLYLGGNPMDTIPDWSVVGDSARYWLGENISGGGDLNNDGYDDFIITGHKSVNPDAHSYIKVYFGGPTIDTIPRLIIRDSSLSSKIYYTLAQIINDINGDGYAEFAYPSTIDTGVIVHLGRDSLKTKWDIILKMDRYSRDISCVKISSVGDINGDGYNDVVTGNNCAWGGLGEVIVYLGRRNLPKEVEMNYYWIGLVTGVDAGVGQRVAWCGDVNGDGLNDVMFSSYHQNWTSKFGRVDIFGGDTSLVVGVKDESNYKIEPADFELRQNYPNPFNPKTTIEFTVNKSDKFTLKIYDTSGREVRTIFSNKYYSVGNYRTEWDGKDENGKTLSSGVYFYMLESTRESIVKKLILLK